MVWYLPCKLNWIISRISELSTVGSMGLAYLPTWMVDFYGFHVGKYTVPPMDPSWDMMVGLGGRNALMASTLRPWGELPDPQDGGDLACAGGNYGYSCRPWKPAAS